MVFSGTVKTTGGDFFEAGTGVVINNKYLKYMIDVCPMH